MITILRTTQEWCTPADLGNSNMKDTAKYVRGGMPFARQTDLKQEYQRIKNLYTRDGDLRTPITLGMEGFDFLKDMYERNPDVSFDISSVVFARHTDPRKTDWGVRVFDSTGQTYEFPSYRHGLRNDPVPKGQIVRRKLRAIVRTDIYEFAVARKAFDNRCDLCGIPNTAGHVDHEAPWTFIFLVNRWAERVGVRVEDIEFEATSKDGDVVLVPSHIHDSWLTYHTHQANLRWLCVDCHHTVTSR